MTPVCGYRVEVVILERGKERLVTRVYRTRTAASARTLASLIRGAVRVIKVVQNG